MIDQPTTNEPPRMKNPGRTGWTKKRDQAPRGVFRHPSGVWAIRFTCGAGHSHKGKIGPLKGDAIRTYHDRRGRAHDEPGWCPATERTQAKADASEDAARARAGSRSKPSP